MKAELHNGSTLAFIGDAVLSLWVRTTLVEKGLTKSKELQTASVKVVAAVHQAKTMQALLEDGILNEEELAIYHRGRNHKSASKAKNADVITYRQATGFEALIGYWYLTNNQNRLEQLWDRIKTTL